MSPIWPTRRQTSRCFGPHSSPIAIEYGWRLALFFYRGLLGAEQLEFALWLAPAVVVATLLGQVVHLRVSERLFRLAVAALLLVAGGLCFL